MPGWVRCPFENAANAGKTRAGRPAEATAAIPKMSLRRPRKRGWRVRKGLKSGGAGRCRGLKPGVGPTTIRCRMRLRRPLLAFALLAAGAIGADGSLAALKRTSLTIDTASATQRFTVDLAVSAEDQAQGLMFRRSLPRAAGMLFDFGATRPAEFWMKNTLIPLDMLFIAADGHVADIHERAVPLSEATIG